MFRRQIVVGKSEVKREVSRKLSLMLSGVSKTTKIVIDDDRSGTGGFVVTEFDEQPEKSE